MKVGGKCIAYSKINGTASVANYNTKLRLITDKPHLLSKAYFRFDIERPTLCYNM